MRRVLTVAVIVAGAVMLVGATLAIAGPGGGDVDACYHNKTGALRVDVGENGCKQHETPISLGTGLVTRRVLADDTAPALGFEGVAASCGEGEVVLGGGYETASIHPDVRPITNGPLLLDGNQAWQVTIINESSAAVDFTAFAICAPGVSTGF